MYPPRPVGAVMPLMYIKSQNAAAHDSTNSIRDPDVVALLADDDVLEELGSEGPHLERIAPEERLEELATELGYDEPVDVAYDAGVGLADLGLDPVDAIGAPTISLEDLGVTDEEARVEFDEDGVARVPQDVGELLANKYDGEEGRDEITIEQREDGSNDGGDD